MMKLYKSLIVTVLFSLCLVSCDDENYFDQERYTALIEQAFPVDSVDRNHDWKTVGTVTANITVNTVEPCVIKVYANNPFTDGKGVLLMEKNVNESGDFSQQFSCPENSIMAYVALTDSKGYTYIKSAPIKDGKLATTISTIDNPSAQRRSMEVAEVPHVTLDINPADYLDGATEVNAQNSDCNREGDPNYVLKMKITGEWNGNINVLASEAPYARTLYVSGKWTLNNWEQRVGGGAVIVVDNGGEIVIPEGGLMNCVNASRVIVMPGGKISGKGQLAFPNGSGDSYSYNGGNINIGHMNNNGGWVYNYGNMTVDELQGGAGLSIYVNHGKVLIDHSPNSSAAANTRIKNGCWWECVNNLHARNIEMGPASYLKAGTMTMSASEDGTADPSYITLSGNSLIDVLGYVSLNNVSITGPASGDYGILQFGSVTFCNYTGGWGSPITSGYVCNNIYLSMDSEEDEDKLPWVEYNQWNPSPYTTLTSMLLNGVGDGYQQTVGNGNAKLVAKGAADIAIEASECTPGYNGDNFIIEDKPFGMRFCFEDNFPREGDYDFNDAVITVTPEIKENVVKLTVSLDAVGASEQIAAALRIVGVQQWQLQSISVVGDFDYTNRPISSIKIIDTQDYILPYHLNLTSDLVINLFNDAHLAMGRQAEKQGLGEVMMPNGNVRRWFYNTVDRNDGLAEKINDVTPVTVVYTLTMNSVEAAQLFVAENFDAFIVEGFNGGYWEVHTYPYKTAQVITPYGQKNMTPYDDNYPWAVQVPGSFKYPKEWTSVGTSKESFVGGAYQTEGHSFGEWARDKNKATDWYEYPTAGMIYE